MAKKFFHDKVYNPKKTIINIVIIGACIIGVIVCFIITSSLDVEDHSNKGGNLSIKAEATVEINEKFDNRIFFSKIDNVDVSDIEVKFPINYDIKKVGKYNVTLVIDKKNYETVLNVVDTTKPNLVLKNLEKESNQSYTAKDFVSSCTDNSLDECKIEFFQNSIDENGNSIDYSKYREKGTYLIKISATDESGNSITKEATLTIGKNETGSGNNDLPEVCKYGNTEYDTKNHLLAVDITDHRCAVSLDLYKSEEMTANINKLMDAETERIKKDVANLNIEGTLSLNRKITAVINTSGNGIVGYELQMIVTLTKKDNTISTVVNYKINKNGERVFETNPYNLKK